MRSLDQQYSMLVAALSTPQVSRTDLYSIVRISSSIAPWGGGGVEDFWGSSQGEGA